MIIINRDNSNLRDTVMVSPWFLTKAQKIILRIEYGFEALNQSGQWEEIANAGKPTVDLEFPIGVMINPLTLERITLAEGETEYPAGCVDLIGFMTMANGAQIGMQDLNTPIYEAMASRIEAFVTVNNLI
jgi:hypothetical protein